jgi:carboxypeptidase Taq
MDQEHKDYKALHRISREARTLQGISSLLDWDQETYMPADGAGIRAEQLKMLAGLVHKIKTGPAFKKTLGKLIDIESGEIIASHLSDPQKAALKEWRRGYVLDKALPKKFVEEFAALTSQSIQVWHHAKQHNTFQQFAPFLDKIVAMSRKRAELLGYTEHPYDALLDLYEPHLTTKEVTNEFGHLRQSIKTLLKKILDSKQVDDKFLHGDFSHSQQMEFGKVLLKAVNYDMSKGRLDLSGHPFSSSAHPTDSRITTRIHPTGLMNSIMAVLHEAGHGLYEMGLPVEQYGSPLGDAISMGMHESQSRWWETRIGLSKPFWQHFLPQLKQHFKGQLDDVSLDTFYKAINRVEPSLTRVEADEVTYGLHVILRFELERALIEGSLSVKEIPEAWNAKMQELLGVTPKTNREGCLQDIHWSMGAFGYFPSYTIGNLYTSHLFQGFEKEHSDWQERVATGDLTFINDWLAKSVYQHGQRYSSKELLLHVTGKPFSAEAYTKYLTHKYATMHNF